MATVDLDFGNILPPEGEYDFMVSGVKVHTTKGTNNKSLIWEMAILGPTNEDAKVSKFTSLLPQARPMLQQWLQGLTGDPWDQDGMSIDTDEFIGLTARGILTHKEYQGTISADMVRCYQAKPDAGFPQFNEPTSFIAPEE